tara:strand:- start:10256 stop:11047 length:792 start_codon:yes stop_codon:yes gene_type:complete
MAFQDFRRSIEKILPEIQRTGKLIFPDIGVIARPPIMSLPDLKISFMRHHSHSPDSTYAANDIFSYLDSSIRARDEVDHGLNEALVESAYDYYDYMFGEFLGRENVKLAEVTIKEMVDLANLCSNFVVSPESLDHPFLGNIYYKQRILESLAEHLETIGREDVVSPVTVGHSYDFFDVSDREGKENDFELFTTGAEYAHRNGSGLEFWTSDTNHFVPLARKYNQAIRGTGLPRIKVRKTYREFSHWEKQGVVKRMSLRLLDVA